MVWIKLYVCRGRVNASLQKAKSQFRRLALRGFDEQNAKARTRQPRIFLFPFRCNEPEFSPPTPHAARFGPSVESADGVVELSCRLVAGRRREFLEIAAAYSWRQRDLHRRHVFERRVRRGFRPAAAPFAADSLRGNSAGVGLALDFRPAWPRRAGAGRPRQSHRRADPGVAGVHHHLRATHKAIPASPWLLGLCRLWVYLIAASTGLQGVNGWPIWCGVALAFYVAGLRSLARRKSFRGPVPYWPVALLAAPVLLAMLMNAGGARKDAILVSLVLVLWVARCARTIFQTGESNVGRIASGLLAGIVLVDWLSVAPQITHLLSGVVFLALFGITLLLQRYVLEA